MKRLLAQCILFFFGFGVTLYAGAPAWGALLGGWIVAGLARCEK